MSRRLELLIGGSYWVFASFLVSEFFAQSQFRPIQRYFDSVSVLSWLVTWLLASGVYLILLVFSPVVVWSEASLARQVVRVGQVLAVLVCIALAVFLILLGLSHP